MFPRYSKKTKVIHMGNEIFLYGGQHSEEIGGRTIVSVYQGFRSAVLVRLGEKMLNWAFST